jgi:hypothetical protein
MRRHRTAWTVAAATLVAGLALGGTPPAMARLVPGQTSWLSRTTGAITVDPDGTRSSTLTVTPALLTVRPLDRLGWKDRDEVVEPHLWVFTTDASKVLGRTIDDGRPCQLCSQAAHEMAVALAADPSATRVEHGRLGGLDVEGDCYLDRADDDVWVRVLAPSGTTFYYMDAYHPWVHAEVVVS